MAFPVTAILDTFDRANSTTTIGSGWTGLLSGATRDRGIIGNQAYDPDGTDHSYLLWNAAQFGPDCETYITIAVLPTGASPSVGLMLRYKDITQDAGIQDGYLLYTNSSTNVLSIFRVDNGVSTQLGATASATLVAGSKVGFSAIGTALTAFHDDGGGWLSIFTRSDSAYPDAGYAGFFTWGDTSWRLDDFGGGTGGEAEQEYSGEGMAYYAEGV